jgi:8-oxo-dGTP diphosphatase
VRLSFRLRRRLPQCSNNRMLQVVAALLEREETVLICRRTATQKHALLWEFPGGKVERGETPEQALERELHEELGILKARGREMERYRYTYPGKSPIELIFFRVDSFTGEPQNLIFSEMRWEPRHNLGSFRFVEGDRRFLQLYAADRTSTH